MFCVILAVKFSSKVLSVARSGSAQYQVLSVAPSGSEQDQVRDLVLLDEVSYLILQHAVKIHKMHMWIIFSINAGKAYFS